MNNFLSSEKNKGIFYLKNILVSIFILFLPFLIVAIASNTNLILPYFFIKSIVFVLHAIEIGVFVSIVIYVFRLNFFYNKETEYQILKNMFEGSKNEFIKSFQKTFIRFILPVFFFIFLLNLFLLKNIFVHLFSLIFIFIFLFVYITIKLFDIFSAKKMNLRF